MGSFRSDGNSHNKSYDRCHQYVVSKWRIGIEMDDWSTSYLIANDMQVHTFYPYGIELDMNATNFSHENMVIIS